MKTKDERPSFSPEKEEAATPFEKQSAHRLGEALEWRQTGLGERQKPPWPEVREESDELGALLQTAHLLRHAHHPPTLDSEARARIAEELEVQFAVFQESRRAELQRSAPSSAESVGISLWRRLFRWLWGESGPEGRGRWRVRPAWALAGAAVLAAVVLWGQQPQKIVLPQEPPSSTMTVLASASGPWRPGVNPFDVTRSPSERLHRVLDYRSSRRQKRWIDALGSFRILNRRP